MIWFTLLMLGLAIWAIGGILILQRKKIKELREDLEDLDQRYSTHLHIPPRPTSPTLLDLQVAQQKVRSYSSTYEFGPPDYPVLGPVPEQET